MLFLLFLPHFLEAPKSEGFCSQSERLHSGRDPKEAKGGTGKAEDAKLPGAGIIPKPCPRKGVAKRNMGRITRQMSRLSSCSKRRTYRTARSGQFLVADQPSE